VFGYLGHGVRHAPKACLLELIVAEWPDQHGDSDHVGLHYASQEDSGDRLLIGREVNEDNTVGVQEAAAKPTTEVMVIEIAAVVVPDIADAVDCQHGEDEAFEATKRISAIKKEHGSEAALDKSLPDVDGMSGGCVSFSRSRATKRISAATKEHGYEAALDKSFPAVDGMVGGCASFSRSRATKRRSRVTKEHGSGAALDKSLPAIDRMVRACEADTWSQREDHIHDRGAMSSDALSLDMFRWFSVPIGTNTVTAIMLSPPARPNCQSAAREHRASAVTSYVEASSQVVKESHSVIDLSQVTTTPFDAVVNGCTCSGYNDLKAGVIYKMKCYNCVRHFNYTTKCLSIHQDTVSCHESCGASLCPKCHTGGVLHGEHQ
jgi:hypothetical protein